MICRLCLINIKVENKVSLFNEMESDDEYKIIKLIAKYLFLEITQSDELSTTICRECYNHLDEFNKFCINVERQQKTLQNEFLAVKCSMDIDLDGDEIVVEDENNVALLDSKDEPIDPFKVEEDEYSAEAGEIEYLDSADDTDYDDVKLNRFSTDTNEVDYEDGEVLTEVAIDTIPPQQTPGEKQKLLRDAFISKHMKLKCDLCQESFKTFTCLRNHFKKIHKCKQYVMCCGLRISDRCDLYNHIQWHLNPEHFKCKECGKMFKIESSLCTHVKRKHCKPDDLIYKCKVCDIRFAQKNFLTSHIRDKHTDKNFLCEHCNKRFVSQCRLNNHTKFVHTEFFPHVCDTCGKKFKYKPSFELHVQSHQGIMPPPEQCNICGEWRNNMKALKLHIKYKHCTPPIWKCKYCDRVFKLKYSLAEHEARHTGDYLYHCPYCVKEFRSHSDMYTHIKNKHKDEYLAAKSAPDGQTVMNLSMYARLAAQKSMEDPIRKLFPITSEAKLNEIDIEIISENRDQYISTMKYLFYDNIGNLKNILSDDIVLAYNVDGSHRMKRLMSFSNFYSALISAIEMLPTTAEKDPLTLLKHALRLQKKRQYKMKFPRPNRIEPVK